MKIKTKRTQRQINARLNVLDGKRRAGNLLPSERRELEAYEAKQDRVRMECGDGEYRYLYVDVDEIPEGFVWPANWRYPDPRIRPC